MAHAGLVSLIIWFCVSVFPRRAVLSDKRTFRWRFTAVPLPHPVFLCVLPRTLRDAVIIMSFKEEGTRAQRG